MRPSQMSAEQSDWWKEVTCVCANNQGLVQIKAIGQCSNLKWACFRGNYLQHVDGLEECPHLEELTLERNWLRSLDSQCAGGGRGEGGTAGGHSIHMYIRTQYIGEVQCKSNV